jgi:transcriptional regulator with XRE-family HTH domain
MSPQDFIAWRKALGMRSAEAARRLGVSPNTVTAYEKGRSEIPLYISLACSAIALSVPPWGSIQR